MEAVMEKLNFMEVKMSKIEEENETLSYDIIGLKRDNHNLKKEIRQLNSKQYHPTKTVQQAEDLQTETDEVRTKQLMDIQDEVKLLKDAVKELKASQNDGQKEVKRLKDEVNVLKASQNDGQKEVKRLKGDLTDATLSWSDIRQERNLLERLKRSLNVILARAQRSAAEFDNKMPALEGRMVQLENNYSLKKQLSSHYVRATLTCRSRLANGPRYKLDECRCLYFGSILDVKTACIDPPSAGCYVVHTQIMQEGKGVLRLCAKYSLEDLFCLQTYEDDDMATCLDLIELQKGQKLWFEVQRLKGNCTLKWCVVNCWLLH